MRAGRSVPGPGDDERLRQDHHAAAQFGFESVGLDPLDGSMPTLLKDRLDGLLDFIHPGLEAAHDVETAEALMGSVLATGGGAARQRADFSVRRSLADVVDGLVERTATV
jgi:carboxylate-amine ligase